MSATNRVDDERGCRKAAQYAALEATSVSLDEEEDPEVVLRQLKKIRRIVAAERRARRSSDASTASDT